MHHKFYLGDVVDCLKAIESNTVQTVVTSPPYWGLRDYGVDGQIGLEASLDEFVGKMVEVFREVNRVLRNDGTLWLNFGDSYAGNGGQYGDAKSTLQGRKQAQTMGAERFLKQGISVKPKDLCGIPWRVALALQADGWYLRSDIIWSKPNPMPSSTKDRPTLSHEYIFLLSKKAHYYYDNEAIKEEAAYPEGPHSPDKIKPPYGQGFTRKNSAYSFAREVKESHVAGPNNHRPEREDKEYCGKRNKRTVWEIATEPCKEAHFATFPTKLVEPCILAGTSPKACPKCGSPWKRVLEPSDDYKKFLGKSYHDHSDDLNQGMSQQKKMPKTFADYLTVDWTPTCKCEGNDGSGKCIVLDPFGGSGTVCLVAQALQRSSIYIDLNPQYLDMALERNGFTGLCHPDTYEVITVPRMQKAV